MSRFQDKMFNYEVTPPAEAWKRIVDELDESELGHQYPSRLYAYEVAPPAMAWHQIRTSLDNEEKTTLSDKKRTIPFFKYVAAAAFIGVLAWGGIRLFTHTSPVQDNVAEQNNISTGTATKLTHQNKPNITEENTATSNSGANTTNEEARNDAALEASKKTYAALNTSINSKLKNAADFYFTTSTISIGNTRGLDFDDPPADDDNNITDRYIMLMTPDGNIIRMSKKLGDLVCCVSGEEQDEDCLDQMKRWREKMANSSVGHSSGNFLDIVNIVNSLQEYED